MRPRVLVAAAAVVAMAGAGVAAAIGSGTIAGFSDTEVSTPDTIGAATVVLGGRGEPPRLVYEGLRPGKAQTVDVAVDYQGSVAADVDLRLTAAAERSGFCAGSGGTLTVAVDQAAAVDYCTLLDGRATRLASVSPGTMARVRVTVTLSADASPALLGRAEQAVVTVQASGGFTDRVRGAFSATTAAPDPAAPAAPGPASAAAAPVEGAPPAPPECPGTFAELVSMTPERPRWSALEERGPGAGPFLIVGTPGPDDIVGSAGADCLVGGDGADRLDGGPGDDRLLGGTGVDDLHGRDGADRLDGGPDAARCDPDPADVTAACLAPDPPPAVEPVPAPGPASAGAVPPVEPPPAIQPPPPSGPDRPVTAEPAPAPPPPTPDPRVPHPPPPG